MVMIGNLCYDEVVNSSEEGMESPISSPHFHMPLSLPLYSNEHQTSSQKLNYFFKSKSYFFSLTPSKKKKQKKPPEISLALPVSNLLFIRKDHTHLLNCLQNIHRTIKIGRDLQDHPVQPLTQQCHDHP